MQERALPPFSFPRRYWACACPGNDGAPTKPSHIYTNTRHNKPGTTTNIKGMSRRFWKEGAAYEAKSLHSHKNKGSHCARSKGSHCTPSTTPRTSFLACPPPLSQQLTYTNNNHLH